MFDKKNNIFRFFSIILVITSFLLIYKLGFKGIIGIYNIEILNKPIYLSKSHDYFVIQIDIKDEIIINLMEENGYKFDDLLGSIFSFMDDENNMIVITRYSILNKYYIWDIAKSDG